MATEVTSFKIFLNGDSFDVVKRKKVDEFLQIVSQSSARFAQFGFTPAQEFVDDGQASSTLTPMSIKR
jgi:hypothetical protein